MAERPYLPEFFMQLRSVSILEHLQAMQPPITLRDYNRRLTFAKKLGAGELLSPKDIKEIEYNEGYLPKSHDNYSSGIFFAYAVDGMISRKGRDYLKVLAQGLNELLHPDVLEARTKKYIASQHVSTSQ